MTQSNDTAHPDHSVLVIGGGLAGIAAAVRLADAGLSVRLIETRKRLGGRATSFVDPTGGQMLDNCQHVLLGCCTQLMQLYQRLGVADRIEWHRRLFFADASGHLDVLEADDLIAPLHMTRSLMSFRTLSLADKLAISRGMLAMMRLGGDRATWHDRSFAQWLVTHGQTPGAIRKFWANIVISAINELPENMAADYAAQVFQEGFLAHEDAYLMGLSSVPLVQLYDAAEQVITDAGGQVMLGAAAEKLSIDQQRVAAVLTSDGQTLRADHFVSALPPDRFARLASDQVATIDRRFAQARAFEFSPIIGIHMFFQLDHDQPVMTLPHLVLMESPLQWLFNKGLETVVDPQTGEPQRVQHLHGVISAAHDLVDQPGEVIGDMAAKQARLALGLPETARVLQTRVVKEKRATFSARPGIGVNRPGPRGALSNLYTAGDWTDTGWPATMEGAVRSGFTAADALLDDAGMVPRDPLRPDLPASRLYRLIAG